MTNVTDRASGAFFLLFGILLYFVVIPAQVDGGGDSWVRPATIPNAMAAVMSMCGVLLILKPSRHRAHNPTEFMFAVLYIALIALGLFVMARLGFVYTAPFIALVVMLLIGERRPVWLAIGAVGMPALIWLLVVQILERGLP